MSDLWVVLVPHGKDVTVFGPMESVEAQRFAQFMAATVDPCEIRRLNSPVAEMFAWYESERIRNECTHAAGCPVHPEVNYAHGPDGIDPWTCTHAGPCPVHGSHDSPLEHAR